MALSNSAQIRLAGIVVIALLILCGWHLARDPSPASIIPLACILYAVFRIIYELTWAKDKVPTLATSWVGRRKMAEVLRQASNNCAGYRITDMGSGRGELSRALARALPDAHVTGIEISPLPYKQSLWLQRLLGPKNIDYRLADFDSYDCGKDDAVVMFLSGNLTAHVGEKLRRELKPGATIISHTFPLRGEWMPVEIVEFRTPFFKDRFFVYRKGETSR